MSAEPKRWNVPKRLWSDEQILDALRADAQRLGRAPRQEEWNPATLEHPSYALVARRFGNWKKALHKAGLQPAPHRGRQPQKKCRRGHLMKGDNIYYYGKQRVCKTCRLLSQKERYAELDPDHRWRRHKRPRDEHGYGQILLHDPCSYCGKKGGEVDHIVAVATGGVIDWDNLTSACRTCNASKGDRPLLVWMSTRRKVNMAIQDYNTIWFPGIYGGLKGDYEDAANAIPEERLIELVQQRAKQDGEWAIENGFVGDNEDKMRKMMAWVSDEENIRQCAKANPTETVDWICRDLANGSKWVGGKL